MGVNGIYGLSGSGLDIESLVKMGMSSKNKQYDKMEQQEIANTWLKEAYNDVYNDLTTYKYGTLSTYKMQSNLNAMSATSSNSGVVTATANGAAASMNHTVTVDSIASNAYLMTTQHEVDGKMVNYGVNRANSKAQTSNKLADVMFQEYSIASSTTEGNNTTFTYNITLADGTKLTNVNGSDVAISLKLKDTAGSDTEYTLSYTFDELLSGFKTGEYTGYTGDQSSVFSGGKTLNDFASAIAKTGANIQGGYDTANDTFSLYNKTSGTSNVIDIAAGDVGSYDKKNTITLLNQLNLGSYNAATGELSDRIEFDNSIKKTVVESSVLTDSAMSTSFKDILGLKATSEDLGGGNYKITVTDKAGNSLGSFNSTAGGASITDDKVAFSLNLSNGTGSSTVEFKLSELFNLSDVGKKSTLGGNAGLTELATEINNKGLGIKAEYDAAKDSFTLSNINGGAELKAGSVGQSVAQNLVDALGLTEKNNITYVKATDTDNPDKFSGTLASVFGLQAVVSRPDGSQDSYKLEIKNANGEVINSQTGSCEYFGTKVGKDDTLFTFDVFDGVQTKTIDVTYGDVFDYDAFTYGENRLWVNGDLCTSTESQGVTDVSNDLGALAKKINDAGLNIKAEYNGDGEFTLLNSVSGGSIEITSPSDSKVKVSEIFNFTGIDTSTMSYKSSNIKRVNDHATYDTLADGLGITLGSHNTSDEAFRLTVGDNDNATEVVFTYGDLFDADGNSTGDLSTLASKISTAISAYNTAHSDATIKVKAAYDETTGKFSLTNEAGSAILSGSDDLGSTLVSRLGLTESAATAANKKTSWEGTNATVTIDGKSYDNDTNKLTVAGVTYTFLDSTQAGQKATISVSQDTDKIVDYMKSFVEEYNKLIDSLNEKLSEQKYSDYKPLSKRQEDEMTEKQIEKWTEKAKSGLLYHNSTIRDLVSAMREAIYTKVDAVDSEYNSLSAIGITSTNVKGHLTLDTDKLRKALADDPDCVYQLFASDQDSTYIAGSTSKNKITTAQQRMDYANTGVANRLYNVMTNYMDKISDIAGTSKETDDQSYLGKLITNMQAKMSNFKTQMTAYENKLFKRYDAMEVALSKLSMQLSYISGSFS